MCDSCNCLDLFHPVCHAGYQPPLVVTAVKHDYMFTPHGSTAEPPLPPAQCLHNKQHVPQWQQYIQLSVKPQDELLQYSPFAARSTHNPSRQDTAPVSLSASHALMPAALALMFTPRMLLLQLV